MTTYLPFPRFLGRQWKRRRADSGLFRIKPLTPPPSGGFSKFIFVAENRQRGKIRSFCGASERPTLSTPPITRGLGHHDVMVLILLARTSLVASGQEIEKSDVIYQAPVSPRERGTNFWRKCRLRRGFNRKAPEIVLSLPLLRILRRLKYCDVLSFSRKL